MGPWGLMSLNAKTCIIMQHDLRKHAKNSDIEGLQGFQVPCHPHKPRGVEFLC